MAGQAEKPQPDPGDQLARLLRNYAVPGLLSVMIWLGLQVWEDVREVRDHVARFAGQLATEARRNDYQDQRFDRIDRLLERRSGVQPPANVN